MKKLLLSIMLVMFLCGFAHAQVDDWVNMNQITVAWDAVTTLTDGTTIPAGQLSYKIWIASQADKSDAQQLDEGITDTTYLLTLNSEGRWYVGVQPIRTVDVDTILDGAPVSWSDDVAVVQGGTTFGIMLYLNPAGVINLRPVQ